MASNIPVISEQTLLDLAMQELGSVEAVFASGRLNGLSITADLTPGSMINTTLPVYSAPVVKYYRDTRFRPASARQASPVLLSGIDYWGLEYDFVVQ